MSAARVPRTITTVGEMRALPEGSVVVAPGAPWSIVATKPRSIDFPHAHPGFWEKVGSEMGTSDEDILEDFGHVLMVYCP